MCILITSSQDLEVRIHSAVSHRQMPRVDLLGIVEEGGVVCPSLKGLGSHGYF